MRTGLEIALLCWLLVVLAGIVSPQSIFYLEHKLIDARMRVPHRVEPSEKIIYVDIDDRSIALLGRWPWSRSQVAGVIQTLSQPKLWGLFVDVLFSEETVPEEDLALVGVLEDCENVFLGAGMQLEEPGKNSQGNQKLDPILESFAYDLAVEKGSEALIATRTLMPMTMLIGTADGLGHISFAPDPDGVARTLPLLVNVKDRYFPSIDIEIARKMLGVARTEIEVVPGKYVILRKARLSDSEEREDVAIPVDAQMRILINYAGPWGSSFRHYPVHSLLRDLLSDDISARERAEGILADKFVILSAAFSGAADMGPTPLEPLVPLSEIHGHAISSIVNRDFLNHAPTGASMIIALFVSLVLGFLSPRLKTLHLSALSVSVVILWIAAAFVLFSTANLVIDITWPCTAIVISYGGCAGYLHWRTERERVALRKAFSNYVSPDVLSRILEDPNKLRLGGERLNLSILVLVLENFERFSENAEPEETIQLLTAVYERACAAILEYGGTVDKFTKDGLIAFFGAPMRQENHPLSAVRAAISIKRDLADLAASMDRRGQKTLDAKMAINVGFATVGNIGSSERMDYTVIGKNVNLCVRMAQSASEGQILIPLKAFKGLENAVEVQDCGEVRFDPYPKPLYVLNVLSLKEAVEEIQARPAEQVEEMQGKKFLGPYSLLEKIGVGNSGTVYKGYDELLDRQVAVKVLFSSLKKDRMQAITEEAKVLAKLNHPNIVQIYYAGEEDGFGFLVMEFVDGTNLRELMNTEGALPAGDALDVIIQTARGLNAAHKKGIVHRDIKPANLLANNYDIIKIADFGLAAPAVLEPNETGRVAGTFQYISPEQAKGHTVDSRSDIYSLGITFYHLLTGETPFKADSMAGLAWHHAESELPVEPLREKGVPESLIEIIQKMTAKALRKRYADYLELLKDLDDIEVELSA